jgi:hypothetical protein
MSNTRSISIWMAGVLAAGALWLGLCGTVAQASDKADTNATAAFNKLKTLAGSWEGTGKRGKVTTSYEVISNGSALVEHINVPGESEMMTRLSSGWRSPGADALLHRGQSAAHAGRDV